MSRIVFGRKEAGNDITATGVEFIHVGKTYTVHVKKEIILSAGQVYLYSAYPPAHRLFNYSAIKSPQVLELSGIGRPDVLSKIGVDLKIDLPGVGENVQEHNLVGVTVEMDPKVGHETLDLLRDPDYAANALKLQCGPRFPVANEADILL